MTKLDGEIMDNEELELENYDNYIQNLTNQKDDVTTQKKLDSSMISSNNYNAELTGGVLS